MNYRNMISDIQMDELQIKGICDEFELLQEEIISLSRKDLLLDELERLDRLYRLQEINKQINILLKSIHSRRTALNMFLKEEGLSISESF